MHDDDNADERGAQLVQAAFERARATGREGWRTMKLAVFKNRLLDATERQFSEFPARTPRHRASTI